MRKMRFFSKKTEKTIDPEVVTSSEAAAPIAPQPTTSATTHWTKRDSRILNATQLQRTQDALKLAEIKLSGQEENLFRLWAQKDWLRRSSELTMLHEREKKRLFELTKQQAAMARLTSLLERYEMFEEIQGTYQRLSVLEKQFTENKHNMSRVESETEEKRHIGDEQEKKWRNAADMMCSAERHLHELQDVIIEGSRMIGASATIESEIDVATAHADEIRQQQEVLKKAIHQKEEEIEMLQSELERHRAGRQSMEMHEMMLEHGELIIFQLSLLHEGYNRCEMIRQHQKEAVKRQEEENEMLGRTYAQYQNIISQIETLEDELQLHRNYMQGLDSYQLQERAMSLRSNGQMLRSALSLWTRIATGYQIIEEKSRQITQLRLNITHHEETYNEQEAIVSRDMSLCKEKEYTYLLSKAQDVIILRADLKEGISCSVCGATHHPYHSDTMLDQSKLIGEMKSDYETFNAEMLARKKQLDELRLILAGERAQLKAEETALNTIRIRQAEDVREWGLFCNLDRSFADCNEQTNLDARTSMLRQLIEKTTSDAEAAQKELDSFNFHQRNVTELSERLQHLEQSKSELNVRLGELNTGCQVMAGSVERLQKSLDNSNAHYRRIYDELSKTITIKDWYTHWQQNPDAIREQIKNLMSAWRTVNGKIQEEGQDLLEQRTILKGMEELDHLYNNMLSQIQIRLERYRSILSEQGKQYENLVGQSDVKALYQNAYSDMIAAQEEEKNVRMVLDNVRHETDRINGQRDLFLAVSEDLDAAIRSEREKLDIWIHSFNLQHSHVQYSELQEAFSSEMNWMDIRQKVRSMQREITLCQARVDDLSSRILSMQTEDGCCHTIPGTDMLQSIIAKQEALLAQRRSTMLLIARLSNQLEDHEKAMRAERNSAEISPSAEESVD